MSMAIAVPPSIWFRLTAQIVGPQGCPVIPATSGGISALLNSAPELIDRIQRLTERLTELLSDKNQNSISDILENLDVTTQQLKAHAPELGDTIAEIKIASHNAGLAAGNQSPFRPALAGQDAVPGEIVLLRQGLFIALPVAQGPRIVLGDEGARLGAESRVLR